MDLGAATYHLATTFTPGGQVPRPAIVPGQNGEVMADVFKDVIKLKWTQPHFSDGGSIDPTAVVYRVFMGTEVEAMMQSYCGIQIAAQQHKISRATREDLTDPHFELDTPSSPVVYFTIVAVISLPDYPSSFSFLPYETIEVSTGYQSTPVPWVKYIGWGLVIALTLLIIAIIRRKSHRASARSSSEYEMMGSHGQE